MARYSDPVCRLCRREGMKLFLKGERCFKPSCAIEKRNYIPGEHGRDRRAKRTGLSDEPLRLKVFGGEERSGQSSARPAKKKTKKQNARKKKTGRRKGG